MRDALVPFETMKFTLVYDGDLPASGNSPKTVAVSRIRNVFHDQFADLWQSHIVCRQLARTARVYKERMVVGRVPIWDPQNRNYDEPVVPINPERQIDLVGPIAVDGVGSFVPLVRKSLYVTAALDIQFLRHEDPGALVLQGGDLDNRLKTLFDALRMPSAVEGARGDTPTADPLWCLLESDTLISDFSVKTGRLLGDPTKKPHAVRLWIDVTVKVLRVIDQNLCLVGD